MIKWDSFTANMTSYLSSFIAQDTKSFTQFLLTQFDISLRSGQTIFGNIPINPNTAIAMTTTLAAMELQLQMQKTFVDVQINMNDIIDYLIDSELAKELGIPDKSKLPSNTNPLISQAISLGKSIVTPLIKKEVSGVIGSKNTDELYKLSKQKIDKESIKEKISEKFNPLDKTFDIIANGISLTLLNMGLVPVPPVPPTVAPNFMFPYPCVLLFPGDVKNLAKDLKRALSDNALIKTPPLAAQMLQLALQKYLMTVGGLYFGMLFVGVALVPAPPIPWIGIT